MNVNLENFMQPRNLTYKVVYFPMTCMIFHCSFPVLCLFIPLLIVPSRNELAKLENSNEVFKFDNNHSLTFFFFHAFHLFLWFVCFSLDCQFTFQSKELCLTFQTPEVRYLYRKYLTSPTFLNQVY